MNDQAKFCGEIRNALAHLYDTAYLECHPLVSRLLGPNPASRLTRAQMLRSLLKEAIEALRPRQGNPSKTPEWRSYLALHHRYVKGMNPLQVQDELGISHRQLQREEHKGVGALAAILWERRIADAEPPAFAADEAGEVQLMRREMEHWEIKRQACTVQALVDDTCWMLRPMLEQLNVNLHVTLPASAVPVLVDPTLARQALFRLLRLAVKAAGAGQVTLQAIPNAQTLDIILQGDGVNICQSEGDWEIAHLLLTHQGGELRQEAAPGTAPRIVMSLPLVSRAKALVVDDVQAVQRLLERYLTPHNYEVIGADNGPEAVHLAAELLPDVIILDVMMPTVDGWQVLRDLQSNPATAKIPVVVCSVLDEPEVALSLGARAFVKKPVNRLELVNTLEQARSEMASVAAARRAATGNS